MSYNRVILFDSGLTGARAYNRRGIAWAAKKEPTKAVLDFAQAIALAPNDSEAYFNRALTYEKEGESRLAIADYQKFTDLASADSESAQKARARKGIRPHFEKVHSLPQIAPPRFCLQALPRVLLLVLRQSR